MKNWMSTIAVICVSGTLIYIFVYLQKDMIVSFWKFSFLFTTLLLVSFFSSAIEAAHSTTKSQNNETIKILETKAAKNVSELESFINNLDINNLKKGLDQINRSDKKAKKYSTLIKLSDPKMTSKIVGSYATLSVVFNTFLAIFIPMLISEPENGKLLIHLSLIPSEYGFTTLLGFKIVSITLPLLMLGKIIPKSLGLNHPTFFIVNFSVITKPLSYTLGGISTGLTWFIDKKTSQ